ncbi:MULTISPECIES: hypothetical protein [Mesorhizobium]|uniref:hypothetical protein n=1 Tax=Mesorhizobium TaxID=68287 RepID=UPI001FCE4B29|nr:MULTISPECIES: hypothetical protein [Mesorhizobium]
MDADSPAYGVNFARRFTIGQPTREDCVRIGAEHNVEGTDSYEAIAIYGENTSLRALCYLLQNCVAASSGLGSIRLPRIENTLRGMSCGSDVLKLLHERRNDRQPRTAGDQEKQMRERGNHVVA